MISCPLDASSCLSSAGSIGSGSLGFVPQSLCLAANALTAIRLISLVLLRHHSVHLPGAELVSLATFRFFKEDIT